MHSSLNLSRMGACSYDAKLKMVIPGLHVTPICTTLAALANMPLLHSPAHGLRYQHITYPNYMLLANTEKSEVMTAVLCAVRGFLQCNDPHCDHRCLLKCEVNGAYTVSRPDCATRDRPGTWSKEGIGKR